MQIKNPRLSSFLSSNYHKFKKTNHQFVSRTSKLCKLPILSRCHDYCFMFQYIQSNVFQWPTPIKQNINFLSQKTEFHPTFQDHGNTDKKKNSLLSENRVSTYFSRQRKDKPKIKTTRTDSLCLVIIAHLLTNKLVAHIMKCCTIAVLLSDLFLF